MGHSSVIVFSIIYIFIPNELLYGVEMRRIPLQNGEEKTTMQPIDIIIINGREYSIPNFLQMLGQFPHPPYILSQGSAYTIQEYLKHSSSSEIQLTANKQILNLSDISRLLGGARIIYITPTIFDFNGKLYTIKTLIQNFGQDLSSNIRISYDNGAEEIYYNERLISPQDLIKLISARSDFGQTSYRKIEDAYTKLGIEDFYKTLVQIQDDPDIVVQLENKSFLVKEFLQAYPNGFTGNIRIYYRNREIGYGELSNIVSYEGYDIKQTLNDQQFRDRGYKNAPVGIANGYWNFGINQAADYNVDSSRIFQSNYNPDWEAKFLISDKPAAIVNPGRDVLMGRRDFPQNNDPQQNRSPIDSLYSIVIDKPDQLFKGKVTKSINTVESDDFPVVNKENNGHKVHETSAQNSVDKMRDSKGVMIFPLEFNQPISDFRDEYSNHPGFKKNHLPKVTTEGSNNYFDLNARNVPISNGGKQGSIPVAESVQPSLHGGNIDSETVAVTQEVFSKLIYNGVTYTPEDIIRALSLENSPNIKIVHNSTEYSAVEFLKKFEGNIPCDFRIYKNQHIIKMNEIPNIVDLEILNRNSDKIRRNIVPVNQYEKNYNGKKLPEVYDSDNISNPIHMLEKNSKDNISILYQNKLYTVPNFLHTFKQRLPRHFQVIINNMVVDLENIDKYIDLSNGNLLENDLDNNFPPIYHGGIIYSPLDILNQMVRYEDNPLKILYQNNYYDPIDYLNNFNINFVPTNFEIVHDGKIINPSDITKYTDLNLGRFYPEIYYRGMKLQPADVINNLANQDYVPIDVLYKGSLYSPKEFASVFNPIPENFEITSGEIILEPEYVVRNLMFNPGTERNQDLRMLLEYIENGSINGRNVPKSTLFALLQTLDIDSIIELLSQYNELNLQVLYGDQIFTLDEIRNQFRNSYYPSSFMVIFNGMTMPIRNVFNYFDLRTGRVYNQINSITGEHRDNSPDTFINNRNIDREFMPKFNYETSEPEQRKDMTEPELRNLISELSHKVDPSEVQILHRNQFFNPKQVLDIFGNEVPRDITFFVEKRQIAPEQLIKKYNLRVLKPRGGLQTKADRFGKPNNGKNGHPQGERLRKQSKNGKDFRPKFNSETSGPVQQNGITASGEYVDNVDMMNIIFDNKDDSSQKNHLTYGYPKVTNEDYFNLVMELSDKPDSNEVQIIYNNQIFTPKQALNQFKNGMPHDLKFVVNNQMVDTEQLAERYNLSAFKQINNLALINLLESNFGISFNGKQYHPKHFAAIYDEGMDFQVLHNNKPITWENLYKLLLTRSNFESPVLINRVYWNPMTILMKIVQHLDKNVDFFIYHQGRTYTPREFFEDFDCKIPNNTQFLINNQALSFEEIIEITNIDADIARFLSSITYIGTDLVKRINSDTNVRILFKNQSFSIPSFIAKYISYPNLNVKIEANNRILNLDEILKNLNLEITLDEIIEANPYPLDQLSDELNELGDSVEIMYQNNGYSPEEFFKIHQPDNSTDFEIIYEHQTLSIPDAIFLLNLDISYQPRNNKGIHFENPEAKSIIKYIINESPPNVYFYYQQNTYTPYIFNLIYGDDIPNDVEIIINNHLVQQEDVIKLLQSANSKQPLQEYSIPNNIVINNISFETHIVLQKILMLLSELKLQSIEIDYDGEKYSPLNFYNKFKANIPTNIQFIVNNQKIALEKLVQILGIDKMVVEIISSMDRIGTSMLRKLVNKSEVIVNYHDIRYPIQEFISKFGNEFNGKFFINNESTNLYDLITLFQLTLDFNELINGIKDIEITVAHELGEVNPRGIIMKLENINYTSKEFVEEFEMDIPKDYDITLWGQGVTIPDVIFLYNLGLSEEHPLNTENEFDETEFLRNPSQSLVNEDEIFFLQLLQRNPKDVYVRYEDILLTPLQYYKINGLSNLDQLEYVVDRKILPKDDIIRLFNFDAPYNNDSDGFKHDVRISNQNNNSPEYQNRHNAFFTELVKQHPKNVFVKYGGMPLTLEQYYMMHGDTNVDSLQFIVDGNILPKKEVIHLFKLDSANNKIYPIIKNGEDFYNPSDLIMILLRHNPAHVNILYSEEIYSPEDFIALQHGYIPQNIEFVENGITIPPAEIITKFHLPEFRVEDKYWPNIVINGKVYTREDFVKILASIKSDCIRIIFEGSIYNPSQFYEKFKGNIPENFEVQLFGLVPNHRLIVELVFDAIMKNERNNILNENNLIGSQGGFYSEPLFAKDDVKFSENAVSGSNILPRFSSGKMNSQPMELQPGVNVNDKNNMNRYGRSQFSDNNSFQSRELQNKGNLGNPNGRTNTYIDIIPENNIKSDSAEINVVGASTN